MSLRTTCAENFSAVPLPPDVAPASAPHHLRGPASRAASRWRIFLDRLSPHLAFAALLSLWEAVCRGFAIPSFLLPAPSAIAVALVATPVIEWIGHTVATVKVALLGYHLTVLISVPLAVGIATSRFLRRTLYPILVVVRSAPIVAVAAIIVVMLGASDLPRVIITFLITFFPILVWTVTGLRNTPEELIELSRSLRAGRTGEILHVRRPFAVPHLFAGLKISTTLAIIGAIVAEFVAAEEGLGFSIAYATSNFRMPTAFSGLFVLVAISLMLLRLVSWLQVRLVPWSSLGADY